MSGRRVSPKTMMQLMNLDGKTVETVEVDLIEDLDGVPLSVDSSISNEVLVVVPEALGWADANQEDAE